MRKSKSSLPYFYLGLFVAIGMSVSGYFISNTLYKAKIGINLAEVKGLAERKVRADSAKWSVNFTINGNNNSDIKNLYSKAKSNQERIIKFLKQNNIKDEEIDLDSLNYYEREYRNKSNVLVDKKKTLKGVVTVATNDVDKIKGARLKIGELVAEGINIYNNPVVYRFTKLNDIKPDMLKEATENARIAANEFANNAGVEVGSIKSARQGGFIIRDEGEDYGDTMKINKTVRVVTNITFHLVD